MTQIAYVDHRFRNDALENIARANLIIREYREDGHMLTVRQLFYQFVSRNIIENSERSYKNLGRLLTTAREAGLVSWSAIEDRNRSMAAPYIAGSEGDILAGLDEHLVLDRWEHQNVYAEVWVEKPALGSIVAKACLPYQVGYLACKGYLSASEAWRAGRRFAEADALGRACHLIHLGDHDPSGLDMTRDNTDRVDLFSFGTMVDVNRIALNMDQIEQYNPPPNPTKIEDSRSGGEGGYIKRFGRECWELDALEPDVLTDLIAGTLAELVNDPEAWTTIETDEKDRRKVLAALGENWDAVREFLAGDLDR
jgi:hypothetical protein